MKRADVVIIGGSLAGAACVRELSRRGIDAVAFDRDRFPREKVCGGFLSPGAVDLLDELGAVGAVRAAGAVEVHSACIRIRDTEIAAALPRCGFGISRKTLDALMADHPGVQHGAVRRVERSGELFHVHLEEGEVLARAVVDAAGKLSRFTRRHAAPQFGIQFYQPQARGGVLDFWFFEDGYGGAVSVEGGRSNACFLVEKGSLPRYLTGEGHRVTGPVAYGRCTSDFIAIGDAAGMMDPFCGEGIRHALDTGLLAARVLAEGLTAGWSYDQIRGHYLHQPIPRWRKKRRLGSLLRLALKQPGIVAAGLRVAPEYWFRRLWA